MEAFSYEEEISFIDLGVPSLMYQQRAWDATGSLLHLEAGIWRANPEGELAVSVALPRVTEISEGTIVDGRISLRTTSVRRAAGGAGLVAVSREYECSGDSIRYRIAMATNGVPQVTPHLEGNLTRVRVPHGAAGEPKDVSRG